MRPVRYKATATDVTNGFTPAVPVDRYIDTPQFSLQYLTAGGTPGTGTVQVTFDDVFDGTITPNWQTVTMLNGVASYAQPARAFRVLTPVLNDVFTVVQQGGP